MREDLLRARAAVRQLQRRSSTLRRTGEEFVLPGSVVDAEFAAPLLAPTAAAIRESLRATSGYLSPRGLAPDRRWTGGSPRGGGGGGRRDASSAAGGSLSGSAPPAAPPGFVAPLDDLQALSDMLRSSYFNLLLVCVPLSWAASSLRWGAVPVFALNFTSLIPLALVLGQITEDLALRYGDTIGGLINATFGNVVEMILTVSALRRGLYQVVSFSLVGSILSNMLMVLGFCYLVGGLIYAEQRFSTLANKAFCSLLFMACIALLVPTSVSIFYDDRVMPPSSVLALSRATAVVMLCIYGAYLYFTLGTHSAMVVEDARVSALATRASSTATAIGGGARSGGAEEEEGEEEVPQVSLLGATLSLSLLTAVIAVASEALTGSIETVTARTGISTAFISVIILPIAGNAAEHLTAVVVAAKGKMDLAQSIALGSSLQISMLALPFAVLAAWAMGRPYSLALDPFSALVLFLSVTHAYATSADGASNWLLGVQLIGTYVLIALPFLYMRD